MQPPKHRPDLVYERAMDAVVVACPLRRRVISHGNIAPWHVVFHHERPAGLIGWELSGPVDPIDEVAVTAWYCAQLFDDDVAERSGLPPAATRAEWFRCFLDGYGLPHTARADLVDRILRFAIRDNGWYARVQGFTRVSHDTAGLWTLAWQSRAALWTLEHRDLLTHAAMRRSPRDYSGDRMFPVGKGAGRG